MKTGGWIQPTNSNRVCTFECDVVEFQICVYDSNRVKIFVERWTQVALHVHEKAPEDSHPMA